VLGRIAASEEKEMGAALDRAADAVEYWIRHGIELTMTRFNGEGTKGGPS